MTSRDPINTLVFVLYADLTMEYEIKLAEHNRTWGAIYGTRLKAFYTESVYGFIRYYEENKASIRMIILDAWPTNRVVLRYLLVSLRGRTPSKRWPPIIVNTHFLNVEDIFHPSDNASLFNETVHGSLTIVDSTAPSADASPNNLNWALFDGVKRPKDF